MLHEMVVHGITLDPLTNMPIVILKDLKNERALPIWIGMYEAHAILIELEKVPRPRPMTHDLLKNVIEELDGTMERVIVNDLRDNTYYATIEVLKDETDRVAIDCRPSDAIAIALRARVPIFVTEKVVESSKIIERPAESEELKEWLDNLKPEDFGTYS